jgi:hypothetical protein
MEPSSRGYALALTALALEVLTGREHRLLWCVDLNRDLGATADDLIDPSNPLKTETQWGSYLQRFRKALDSQPWNSQRCKIVLRVRYEVDGKPMEFTFAIPYSVNLTLFGAPPPIGCWRLWRCPPRKVSDYDGRETLDHAGDRLPASFWYDGIPF